VPGVDTRDASWHQAVDVILHQHESLGVPASYAQLRRSVADCYGVWIISQNVIG
jgi:hypothetical protein